ncbi:hypothetical protein BGX26_003014 [Mortierella sp. AD094]|nr:hypothetical protein BGX26_003014 [Mortierella sp. AD094]
MLAMVIQGACTGLVPVSKCAIGELANRQQHLHDAEVAMEQRLQEQEQLENQQKRRTSTLNYSEDNLEEILDEKIGGLSIRGLEDLQQLEVELPNRSTCAESGCFNGEYSHNSTTSKKATPDTKQDFAAKGYSAIVISLALGAACGLCQKSKGVQMGDHW